MAWFLIKWGLISFAILYLLYKIMPQMLRSWIAAKWNGLWAKILKK